MKNVMRFAHSRPSRLAASALALVLVSAVVAAGAFAAKNSTHKAPVTVNGTVGPGFTINLTRGGKHVKSLKRGTYRFAINDRSDIHNFHLVGPGLSRVLTGVGFLGKRSAVLTLKKGKYSYFCDPHKSIMHGSFLVA